MYIFFGKSIISIQFSFVSLTSRPLKAKKMPWDIACIQFELPKLDNTWEVDNFCKDSRLEHIFWHVVLSLKLKLERLALEYYSTV